MLVLMYNKLSEVSMRLNIWEVVYDWGFQNSSTDDGSWFQEYKNANGLFFTTEACDSITELEIQIAKSHGIGAKVTKIIKATWLGITTNRFE
jgi:hypothetical protein